MRPTVNVPLPQLTLRSYMGDFMYEATVSNPPWMQTSQHVRVGIRLQAKT